MDPSSNLEKLTVYDGLFLTLLVSLLIALGGIIGYELAPNMPVWDARIYAPAAPDPSIVFTPEKYLEGFSDGLKVGKERQFSEDLRTVTAFVEAVREERDGVQ